MPVRPLTDLAVRALTSEQRNQIRPILVGMPMDVQTGFLAMGNHAFRRFVRKVMILRNALVGPPRLRVRAIPLTFDFWSWLSQLWERLTTMNGFVNNAFVNTANEWT